MYTEQALLETRALRATLSHRTEVLDEVKRLPLLPDREHTTATMLAEYFEVDAVVLRRVVRKHASELGSCGHRQLRGEEQKAFLAVNMPRRGAAGRGLAVFTRQATLVLAMLLHGSEVVRQVRLRLLEAVGAEAGSTEWPLMVRVQFPVTGQPVRVVLIGGEPWFAMVDVCTILGIENARDARNVVDPEDIRTADSLVATVGTTDGADVSAGHGMCSRDLRRLNLVSEAGLYTLIMKSRKPAAKPFQRWVTAELLPSLRRGDTDFGAQQARMAETLAEAIGQQVHVVADVGQSVGRNITVMSDGTIHCLHGEMEICVPSEGNDSGPPFGPYYRCPEVERIGIRGSRRVRTCGTIKFVEVIRQLSEREPERDAGAEREVPEPRTAETGTVSTDSMFLAVGTPEQIAEVMRRGL